MNSEAWSDFAASPGAILDGSFLFMRGWPLPGETTGFTGSWGIGLAHRCCKMREAKKTHVL